jgi:ribosomal protein L13E
VADALGAKSDAARAALGRLALVCRPKGAGVYSTRVMLKAFDCVRVFEVEFNVEAAQPVRSVTFTTPARPGGKGVTQALPVANPTLMDWRMGVALRPVRKNASAADMHFSCPDTLLVPAGGQVNLPVTFAPEWVGDELATLTLTELKELRRPSGQGVDPAFSLQDLKALGYTCKDMRRAGFTLAELKNGYTAADMKLVHATTKAELANDGFSLAELKLAGFHAPELKIAGFSVKDLTAVGFTKADINGN